MAWYFYSEVISQPLEARSPACSARHITRSAFRHGFVFGFVLYFFHFSRVVFCGFFFVGSFFFFFFLGLL